jgi:phytochrome-interacting factor 3
VWENGQILKQGQSSRPRKSPTTNSLPSHTPKTRDKDIGNGTSSKMGKFGGMDSVLDEIPMSVPSGEMDLSQDDDMMPWLNYPIDESLQHEYCSEFLPELSGVTVNELSAQNNLASIDKSSSCNMVYRDCHTDFVNDGLSLRHGDMSKVSSVVGVEATRPRNSSFPLYPSSSQQCQTSLPSLRSRVSDVTGNNMSTVMHHAVCGDSTRVASAAGGFPSIKMQKKDPMPPSNNPNLMNFSHFSRPAALVSTLINSSSGLRKESSSHCQPVAVPLKVDLKSLGEKPIEEPIATEQSEAVCQGDASKNDKSFNQVRGESATKGLPDGEKPIEPVVASSSVCSGNSVERASDDPTHSLKRKCRDTEESECHSEVSLCIGITSFQFPYFICFLHLPRKHYHVQDVEEESMGTKKAAPARGGVGSKRSRAAEVHNLSERVSNTIQD